MATTGRRTQITPRITHFVLLLVFCVFFVGCGSGTGESETETQNKDNKDNKENARLNALFEDGQYHLSMFTNPTTDCIACIDMTLRNLDKITPKDQPIPILLKPNNQKDKKDKTEDFKKYVTEKFPQREFLFAKSQLTGMMHPSVVLIKNQGVHMVFYISTDPYDLKDAQDKCLEWFKGMEIK